MADEFLDFDKGLEAAGTQFTTEIFIGRQFFVVSISEIITRIIIKITIMMIHYEFIKDIVK